MIVLSRDVTWVDVCGVDDVPLDRGVCALVGTEAVAVFRIAPYGEVLALSNTDPFSGASVLSRGLVGSKGAVPVVWSPMYKQAFDLYTGRCLDDPEVAVPTYPARILKGRIQVGIG